MFKEGQIIALDTPKLLVNQFLIANYLTFICDDADLELFQLAKEKRWKGANRMNIPRHD